MESWENLTTMRDAVREEDSPVEKAKTKVEETRSEKEDQEQVSNGQPLHVEEQSRSKNVISHRYERRRKREKLL